MGRLLVAIYVLYEHLCDELSVLPLVNTAMIIYLWCVDALPYDRDRFGFTISLSALRTIATQMASSKATAKMESMSMRLVIEGGCNC